MTRLYNRFINNINFLTTNNSNLYDLNLNRKLTLFYSIYPNNMFLLEEFKNSFYELFFKNSFIGTWTLDNNIFTKAKENIFQINNNNIQNEPGSNNFFQLSLSSNNIYTINNINDFPFNNTYKKITELYNDTLVVLYNNNYNNYNFQITLLIENNEYSYNNIQLYQNYLLISIPINTYNQLKFIKIFKLIINYNTSLPLLSFYKNPISYPKLNNNIINNYSTLSIILSPTDSIFYIHPGYYKYGISTVSNSI
jgi:hypothetical protein